MADILKGFVNFFKFSEDDYDDDYDEAEEETATVAKEKETRPERVADRKVEKSSSTRQQSNSYTEVPTRRGRQSGEPISNVVPIHKTTSGLEVCIMKPHSFGDSDKICEALLSGHAVVINLEGFDTEPAQRIIDFVSGAVFAIEGKFYRVSRYIFICSPGSVDITESMDEISKSASSIGTTIDKDF
jgi:cell division inhibitor SepF